MRLLSGWCLAVVLFFVLAPTSKSADPKGTVKINKTQVWEDTFNGTDWYDGILFDGEVNLPAAPGNNCTYEVSIQMIAPLPPYPSFGYVPWVKPWTGGQLFWNTWICAIDTSTTPSSLMDWPPGTYTFQATVKLKSSTGMVMGTIVSAPVTITVP